MTRVCHLFDGAVGWEQRVGASQLIDRLPTDRFECSMAAVGSGVRSNLGADGLRACVFPSIAGMNILSAPSLARFVAKRGIGLVHAWGPRAAMTASVAGGSRVPVVVELHDPRLAVEEIRLLRSIADRRGFAVICSCETIRRRLIERGIAPDLCVVIRPGVDFSLINRYRKRSLREKLGLTPEDLVAIVPEPATRADGQLEAVWAVQLIRFSGGGVKIILPGESRERQRILRLTRGIPGTEILVAPGNQHSYLELLVSADVLVVASQGDISTTSIAWAMGANVAVIGSAVHAVAELIANKMNGLLFKRTQGETAALPIARLLLDREAQRMAKEAAAGQAYEVFGLRRCMEQHMRLYENVISGAPPGDGIVDSAVDA